MKCPTCRRPAAAEECSRCGTDLTLLSKLDAAHERFIQLGHTALQARDCEAARTHFERALNLRKSSAAARKGLALTALLQRDFPTALRHYLQFSRRLEPRGAI